MLKQGAYFQAEDYYIYSCLHMAAEKGFIYIVEYLADQKADINAKTTCVEFLYLIGLLFI